MQQVSNKKSENSQRARQSRRRYLQVYTALAAANIATRRRLPLERTFHARGSEILKLGLVGCGDGGTGAAADALRGDPHTKLVAMGDLFWDRLEPSRRNLRALFGDRVDVPEERAFLGLDAYRHVIECSDVVLLALPTFFHPHYLKAAIEAGRHVFCEKIHAVDAPGVQMVLEAAELARKKRSFRCFRLGLAI